MNSLYPLPASKAIPYIVPPHLWWLICLISPTCCLCFSSARRLLNPRACLASCFFGCLRAHSLLGSVLLSPGPPSSLPVYPHATSPSCFLDSPTPTPQPRLLPLPPFSYPAFGYNFISCPLADHLLRDSWQHASSEVAGTECLAHFRRFFFFFKDLLDKIFAVDKFSYPKLT